MKRVAVISRRFRIFTRETRKKEGTVIRPKLSMCIREMKLPAQAVILKLFIILTRETGKVRRDAMQPFIIPMKRPVMQIKSVPFAIPRVM